MPFKNIINYLKVPYITSSTATTGTKELTKKIADIISTPDALKHLALATGAIGMAGIAINQSADLAKAEDNYKRELEAILNKFSDNKIEPTNKQLELCKDSEGKYSVEALKFLYKYITTPNVIQGYESTILHSCKDEKNNFDNNALDIATNIIGKNCHTGYISEIIDSCKDSDGKYQKIASQYIERILDCDGNGYAKPILQACKNPDATFNDNALSLITHFINSYDKEDIGYLVTILHYCQDNEHVICEEALKLVQEQIDNKLKAGYLCNLTKTCKESDGTFNIDAFNIINNIKDNIISHSRFASDAFLQLNEFLSSCKRNGNFEQDALDFLQFCYTKDIPNTFNHNSIPDIIDSCLQMGESQYAAFEYAKIGIKYKLSAFYLYNIHANKLNEKNAQKENIRELYDTALMSEKMINYSDFIYNLKELLNKADQTVMKNDNIEFLKKMIKDESISPKKLHNIVKKAKEYPEIIEICKELINTTDLPVEGIPIIDIIEKLQNYSSAGEITERIIDVIQTNYNTIDKINSIKANMMEHPDLYISGEYNSTLKEKISITNWLAFNFDRLAKLCKVLDKETIDYLMRLRLDNVDDYLDIINDEFSRIDLDALKKLTKSKNTNGEDFKPKEKLEMIDLIQGYNDNNLSILHVILNMTEENKVDLNQLRIDLFHKIMLNAGMSEEDIRNTPEARLRAWDIKYSHLLSKDISYTNDDSFEDLIRAANLYDFKTYIHDTSNKYGRTNATTKAKFIQMNMNYDRWINPRKENEIHFVATDENTEQLNLLAEQIKENMNVLMKTPAKGLITKQFKDFVKGDEFIIPNDYSTNKTKLKTLIEKIINEEEQGQLYQIWKRAKENSTCGIPEREAKANGTLTILDHLKQKLSDIDKIKVSDGSKNVNLTIKMWERIPQKDLFQGNYSTCCIGIGRGNGEYMPHYLMDTAFNMIEIVNENGKVIGNALCYFVKDSKNQPAFIIDNVEINDAEKPSKDIIKPLRTALVQYAENIAKDVTGRNNTHIYISDNWNDIDVKDLPKTRDTVEFLGDIDCDEIYLDLYHDGESEPIECTNLIRNNQLLQLK